MGSNDTLYFITNNKHMCDLLQINSLNISTTIMDFFPTQIKM